MKQSTYLLAVLVAAVLGLVGYRIRDYRQKNSAPEEKPSEAVLIQVAPASRGDLTEKLALTGNIRPRNEVDVFPKLGGRIESLGADVGDKVKAGQLLASIEHKEIAWQARAAEAASRIAHANLDGAKQDMDRVNMLFQGGSATQAQVDGAKLKVTMAEAQVAQAEAAQGLAEQNLDNARITTPISGTVTRRPVNVGNQVGPQSALFTVQDIQALKLESSVDASVFGRLSKGQEVAVTVDAFPGQVFKGELALLAPALDPTTRRAACEIQIDNASGKLLANAFARAELSLGKLQNVLTVPRQAVLEAPGGAVVYRVVGGSKVEAVRPKLGASDGARVVVVEGLSEGDLVAVSGVGNLADGAAVKVAPQASAPDAPAKPPAEPTTPKTAHADAPAGGRP
ncbi:MAG TPA: efflux RND transporter periplasmic adaptor subunit [Myxococcaceae bacterium]|nr:efflux RND transporter periplasmic adaptor subunit [Myxococcaceae bacterium]